MEPENVVTDEPAGPTEVSSPKSTEIKPPRAKRRRFCVSEKLRILSLADACGHGELGALLRREGVYASSLGKWRLQREQGALAPKKRGPQAKVGLEGRAEKKRLVREVQRLSRRLEKAELIIEMQKKMAFLLSSPLPD